MNCPRCEGLLMSDQVFHSAEALYMLSIWRCLNCGEVFDSTTLQNRTNQNKNGALAHPKSTHWSDARSPLAIRG